jgi:uncharacterized protein (TIGR02246 family)
MKDNTMKKRTCLLLCSGLFAMMAVGLLAGRDHPSGRAQANEGVADAERKADEEAVRTASAELSAAVERGDAKALANLWTEEGEYIGGDGTTIRGRSAIETAYARHFAKDPRIKLELSIDSIRFVSRDSAIVEGHAQSQKGKANQPSSSRYSLLRVRENGNWLIAVLREWPDEGITLRDMDWLIGTWTARTDGGEVRSTYEWDETKKFIRCRFTVKNKDNAVSGTQYIGRDPRTGNLRSWLFESEGGFGNAEWSWDGKRWIQDATGVQADGDELTSTNILTPIDKDSFTWQSIDRTENGEAMPNIPPVKVTRVK